MSLTRRLAAGLPAVGVTFFAALALSGAPASAAPDDAARAAQPVVMATPDGDGYGGNGPAATTDSNDHRGNPGYGGESPTTTPPTTAPTTTPPTTPVTTTPATPAPTGNVNSVPPGGVSPTTVAPSPSESTPGGVSPAGTLPLTGAPTVATVGAGAALVGAGVFAIWYSRRRRSA